jgi:hypothetical protein
MRRSISSIISSVSVKKKSQTTQFGHTGKPWIEREIV